jgi:hypothetical protein
MRKGWPLQIRSYKLVQSEFAQGRARGREAVSQAAAQFKSISDAGAFQLQIDSL